MDACDPSVAPGVGTPVRGGLDYREAHMVMEIVADSQLLVALDLVEVNPTLDVRNTTAEFGDRAGAVGAGERNSVGPRSTVRSLQTDRRPETADRGRRQRPSSFSISSITSFIRRIVRSSGSSVVMSTPASFSRSIGYFDPPDDEERQVALRRGLIARQHLRRQRFGGGERRGVLEHVEVAIEVRDEAPLVRDVVVDDRRPSGRGRSTCGVMSRYSFASASPVIGSPLLPHLVHPQLELGELRLPEHGGLDALRDSCRAATAASACP